MTAKRGRIRAEVIRLDALTTLSYHEIAYALGIEPTAVVTILLKARPKIDLQAIDVAAERARVLKELRFIQTEALAGYDRSEQTIEGFFEVYASALRDERQLMGLDGPRNDGEGNGLPS